MLDLLDSMIRRGHPAGWGVPCVRSLLPTLSALQYVCTPLKTQYTASCHLNYLPGHGCTAVGSGGVGVLLLAWAAYSSAEIQKACASTARAFRPFWVALALPSGRLRASNRLPKSP